MARPEEFTFEAHCCGNAGTEGTLLLKCRVCPSDSIGMGFELTVEDGDMQEAFRVIADHVHRDPMAKPCHRIIHGSSRRKALEV